MTISYQKCGLSDISLIQETGRATYKPYYHQMWDIGGVDWYMERCFGKEVLEIELGDPNIEYLIPRNEHGQVIGILKLLLQQSTPDNSVSNALYLEKIYLMPEFFGKGIGQMLIEQTCKKAVKLGREAIWLTVMQCGPVKAYERAGFHQIGEVYWDFELLKPTSRKGLVMVKTLVAMRNLSM